MVELSSPRFETGYAVTKMRRWASDNALGAAIVFAAMATIYSSLVTGVVWTNHTIPNALAQPYPSYRTWMEGRWFADMLLQIVGSAQGLQVVLGLLIQALNGFLFAELLRVRGGWERVAVALLVGLHPTVLDYYAFTSDSIGFTLGDTLVVVAALLVQRAKGWLGPSVAMFLIMLALAIYQPKIGVLLVVFSAGTLMALAARPGAAVLMRELPRSLGALIGGIALYFASSQLLISVHAPRNHVNSAQEMLVQFMAAYPAVANDLFMQATNMPRTALIALPAMAILGAAAILLRIARQGMLALFGAIVVLALLPAATRFSFIVNANTWENAGRIGSSQAYALALLAAAALGYIRSFPRLAAWVPAVLLLHAFAFIGAQENGFLAMKTVYETAAINRVVSRIEDVLPPDAPSSQAHPIVVFGELPLKHLRRLLTYPDRPFRPTASERAYIDYRQVDITNFFLGSSRVTYPSVLDIDTARTAAVSHAAWPHEDSIFMAGNVLVVQLSPASELGIPTTTPLR